MEKKESSLKELFEQMGLAHENPKNGQKAYAEIYERLKEDVMANCIGIAYKRKDKLIDYRTHGRDLFQETMIILYEKAGDFKIEMYDSERLLRAGLIAWLRKIAERKMSNYIKKFHVEDLFTAIAEQGQGSRGDDSDEEFSDSDIVDRKVVLHRGAPTSECWKMIDDPFVQDADDILPKDILRKADVKKKMGIIHDEVEDLPRDEQDILYVGLKHEKHTPSEELNRIETEHGINRVYFRKKKERIREKLKNRVIERYNKP